MNNNDIININNINNINNIKIHKKYKLVNDYANTNKKNGKYNEKYNFWELIRKYDIIIENGISNKEKDWEKKSIDFIYSIPKENRIIFIKKYKKIHHVVNELMFGDHTIDCCYPIGADDGHMDFARYLMRKGKQVIKLFIENPKSKTIYDLANKMNTEGSPIDNFDENGEIDE